MCMKAWVVMGLGWVIMGLDQRHCWAGSPAPQDQCLGTAAVWQVVCFVATAHHAPCSGPEPWEG
jgi:hypothetical protein